MRETKHGRIQFDMTDESGRGQCRAWVRRYPMRWIMRPCTGVAAAAAVLACGPDTTESSGSSETTGTDSTDPTQLTMTSPTATTTVGTTDTTTTASTTDGTSTTDPSDPTVPTGDTGSSESGPTSDPTSTDGSSSSDDGGSSSESTGELASLDDWTRRRQVLIDNANDVGLIDHEIAIDLDIDEDMNPDLSDLRFTDASGTELLPHWLETSVPTISFRAWVRVPEVPEDDIGSIYMWYGNPNATDASDAAATFHFWDGFDGNELSDTWTSNGEYVVAGGTLTITNGSVYSAMEITEAPGWVAEARMRWPNDDDNHAGSGVQIGSEPGFVGDVDFVTLSRGNMGLVAALVVNGDVVFNQIDVPMPTPPDELEWLRVGAGPDQARMGWGHAPAPASSDIDANGELETELYLWLGENDGVGLAEPEDIFDLEIDAVVVRRFEQLRPSTSQGPEEDV